MKKKNSIIALFLTLILLMTGCGSNTGAGTPSSAPGSSSKEASRATSEQKSEDKGLYILFTNDVHCGVDEGLGYAGLWQIRRELESEGYETILVDNGDFIQGGAVGTLTKGEAIIRLMNKLKYDVAIPGDHEFDYGMDRFNELVKMAEFPLISCNFNKEGSLIFKPYTIIEKMGKKIAFVGVTTPQTPTKSTPSVFQDGKGNFIYDFLQDKTGEKLYAAVQKAVDAAAAEGADYIYLMAHLGNKAEYSPWTYADVVSHTKGIDVVLDGHSHDTEQVTMKNLEGKTVARSSCGTKLNAVGYSLITPDGKIKETNIWSWPNSIGAPKLLSIKNEMSEAIAEATVEVDAKLKEVVAKTDVELTINDPKEKDSSGNPIRMVRRSETNLGDLCADALKTIGEADIGLINAGGIRTSIPKGDITYGNIMNVFPFENQVCVINATGQQILDALEWASKDVPNENGAFLHVSGLTYEVDSTVPSTCEADVNNMFTKVTGTRRVSNVKVGDAPIDPGKKYSVAGIEYNLMQHGDGLTAFDGAEVLKNQLMVDNQLLIDYITKNLKGTVSGDYADPYGQGRIKIKG